MFYLHCDFNLLLDSFCNAITSLIHEPSSESEPEHAKYTVWKVLNIENAVGVNHRLYF